MELQKVSAGILALNALLGVVVLFLSSMIWCRTGGNPAKYLAV